MSATKIFAAGFAAAAMLTSSAFAADVPANPRAALDLAKQMASTALRAETGVAANETNQHVTAALQTLIVGTGAEPRLVALALQTTLTACQDSAGRGAWTCPRSPGSYDALRSLQSIVIAQLDQAGVAALGAFGSSPFGSLPVTAPGGSALVAASVPSTSSGGSGYVAP